MKHDFSYLKTATFRGRRFEMHWRCPSKGLPKGEYRGAASDPDDRYSGGNELYIWPKQTDWDLVGTVAHESLHACVPSLKEEIVEDFEHDFLRLLKRMGAQITFQPKK
jgi:hypothetical protein